MTSRRLPLVIVAIVCLVIVIYIIYLLFCGQRSYSIFDESAGMTHVVVTRHSALWDVDTYYYEYSLRDELHGPYYLSPAFTSDPDLAMIQIGQRYVIISDKVHRKDVFVFIDLQLEESFPSPQTSLDLATINLILDHDYVIGARMVSNMSK